MADQKQKERPQQKNQEKPDQRSSKKEEVDQPSDLSTENIDQAPGTPDQDIGKSISEMQQETEGESKTKMTKELLLKIHEMIHEKAKFKPGDTLTTEEGQTILLEIDERNCRFMNVSGVRWVEQDPKATSDFAREIALGFRITVGVKTGNRGLIRQNNNNVFLDLSDGTTNFLDEYRPQFRH